MASYLSPAQMGALLGSWLLLLVLFWSKTPHPLSSLLLFCTLPLLLSSLQLFVIGTYLPHRQTTCRSGDRHHAASLAWPEALSFLACFHFGYHWEHHADPRLPWYCLPAGRRRMTVPIRQRAALALPLSSR
jgi:beta-carotene ketolase (CrtW type)